MHVCGGLTEEGRELCEVLKANLDVFAWKPVDMTCVRRTMAEHMLGVKKGTPPSGKRKEAWHQKGIRWRMNRVTTILQDPEMVHQEKRLCLDERSLNSPWRNENTNGRLPTLTAPIEGETLIMYLSVVEEAISVVLLAERARRLRRYFQAHPIGDGLGSISSGLFAAMNKSLYQLFLVDNLDLRNYTTAHARKTNGYWLSPRSASRTTLIGSSTTDKYIINVSLQWERLKLAVLPFVFSFLQGLFRCFDKNLFRLASFPFRLCTSFNVLEEGMLIMAWAFSLQAWILSCLWPYLPTAGVDHEDGDSFIFGLDQASSILYWQQHFFSSDKLYARHYHFIHRLLWDVVISLLESSSRLSLMKFSIKVYADSPSICFTWWSSTGSLVDFQQDRVEDMWHQAISHDLATRAARL
ncbi:hypothetical protein Tco_1409046 [Tanacetum coccineum]